MFGPLQACNGTALPLPIIRTLYIYVNKDVRICGYFPKPKGVREQTRFGNTDLNAWFISPLCPELPLSYSPW